MKKYQSRKRTQTGKTRPVLKQEVTETHWIENHFHQNALKSIKDKISKPVVAKEQRIPIAVLKLQRRKLEANDPIGNPVFFQRKPGQEKLGGSLDPFVKKVMVNSVRVVSPMKQQKAGSEFEIQRMNMLEQIKRIKKEKQEMLRLKALAKLKDWKLINKKGRVARPKSAKIDLTKPLSKHFGKKPREQFVVPFKVHKVPYDILYLEETEQDRQMEKLIPPHVFDMMKQKMNWQVERALSHPLEIQPLVFSATKYPTT